MDVVYGDDEETSTIAELVSVYTGVDMFTFGGEGTFTANTLSGFASGFGTADGQAGYMSESQTPTTYTVNPSGTVDLVIDAETTSGFTDSEGDLITLGDANSRVYAVKLSTGVTNSVLAGKSFDLQGVVIDSSNASLNASTYVGSVATFILDEGVLTLTLSGSITKAVAAFSVEALPSVTTTTEPLTSTSSVITVDSNGRLSPITFPDSGLELEGFVAANGGLLLRIVDTFAQAADTEGEGGGTAEAAFVSGEITNGGLSIIHCSINEPTCEGGEFITSAIVDFVTLDPITVATQDDGDFGVGFVSVGGGTGVVPGAVGNFTSLLRDNDSVPQDFNAIDTAAGESYENYTVTQGILFGVPAVLAP
jgi:hypothetical protein